MDGLDWPSGTMMLQQQLIKKRQGCSADFAVDGSEDGDTITVFMTRADTLMGMVYVTLALEHPLVGAVAYEEQREEVEKYVVATST